MYKEGLPSIGGKILYGKAASMSTVEVELYCHFFIRKVQGLINCETNPVKARDPDLLS